MNEPDRLIKVELTSMPEIWIGRYIQGQTRVRAITLTVTDPKSKRRKSTEFVLSVDFKIRLGVTGVFLVDPRSRGRSIRDRVLSNPENSGSATYSGGGLLPWS